MMKLKSIGAASLLALSVFALGGCDQVEKSAQQLVGKATETAKQAIDDTHKAAEQALSDATQGLISNKDKTTDDSQQREKSSQEI
jgi:vacuolar-type H+-ATPase subunit H